jgi:hypothetical protein
MSRNGWFRDSLVLAVQLEKLTLAARTQTGAMTNELWGLRKGKDSDF